MPEGFEYALAYTESPQPKFFFEILDVLTNIKYKTFSDGLIQIRKCTASVFV